MLRAHALTTARWALSKPGPQLLPQLGIGVALVCRSVRISAGVIAGAADSIKPTVPLTCGAESDVPER